MSWAETKTKEEKSAFADKVIRLSQMVEDGKLNSNAAKEVFSELYDAHMRNLHYIKEIDAMPELNK